MALDTNRIKKGNRVNNFPKKPLSMGIFNLTNLQTYEKNKPFGELFYRSLKKALLIMRIAVFLMVLGILQARAVDAYSRRKQGLLSIFRILNLSMYLIQLKMRVNSFSCTMKNCLIPNVQQVLQKKTRLLALFLMIYLLIPMLSIQ